MINKALYNKTVDILVAAYFDDTLKHGDCTKCAVGNLCLAAGARRPFDDITRPGDNASWKMLFFTSTSGNQRFDSYMENYSWSDEDVAYTLEHVIHPTGYSVFELAKIEHAFETAPKGDSDEAWMFNGLMAVIEVLDIIHKNTDEQVTTQAKEKFLRTQKSETVSAN